MAARASLVQQLIKRTSPKLALHFGVSKRASGFQIELVGRNICDLRIDAAGDLPSAAHLIDAGPDELPSSFPARRIIARLESAGLPWATSESAGSYVCNALLYHSLISAKALPTPCLSGFVHLPVGLRAGEEAEAVCALSWSQALSGSLEIIAPASRWRALLNHPRGRYPPMASALRS
ncbi:MAG: hypothetical protein WDN31_16010 [Hyphomicrobium sp.]